MAFGDTLDTSGPSFPTRCRVCLGVERMTEAEVAALDAAIANPKVSDKAVTRELIAHGYLPEGTDYQPVRRHRVNGHR